MTARPMFPLEQVLLPGDPLRLQVFEPRYRALVADVLGSDGAFGVTLIERGSEVGGGDVRTDIGTLAKITSHQELSNGRILLVCKGTERIRVNQWLDDDPYPRANLATAPDDLDESAEWAAARDRLTAAVADVQAIVDEAAAKAGALAPGPIVTVSADDPTAYTYAVGTVLPFTPLDRQRILQAPSPVPRAAAILSALDDVLPLIRARMLDNN